MQDLCKLFQIGNPGFLSYVPLILEPPTLKTEEMIKSLQLKACYDNNAYKRIGPFFLSYKNK